MFKIVQCAFLCKSGVVPCGQFHNIDVLPQDAEILEEGFLTSEGSFVTRHEVSEDAHSDHEIQSEELHLAKAQTPPAMPQLGIENRRPTPIIQDPKQQSVKQQLMYNAADKAGLKVRAPSKSLNPKAKVVGLTGQPNTGTSISFAAGKSPMATQQHEDLHQMFNRVADKHGFKAMHNLATNLYHAIPEDNRNAMRDYVKRLYPENGPQPGRWHEEHLAHLLSYLNSYGNRKAFHMHHGSWDENQGGLTEEGRNFNVKMKQAHRHLQDAAKRADKSWLDRFLHKSEIEAFLAKDEFKPNEADVELALEILHAITEELLEFKAAKYLAQGYIPTHDEMERALRDHEGEHEMAALTAYRIPITEENIKQLKQLTQMFYNQTELSKSEIDVSIIPRIVKPYNDDGIQVADVVRRAFELNDVFPLKLKGKHSKGVALIRDLESGRLWLLKPGSGKVSPAMGVAELKATQSQREVIFNKMADILGLGNYVPQTELLKLDGEEIAALEFFPGTLYTTADKVKKQEPVKLKELFERFVNNGLLFKFLFLDYIGGSADEHAGNTLVSLELQDLKFIDHGSSLAGPSFNPAKDVKSSFSPFIIRYFVPNWKVLTPGERVAKMPIAPNGTNEAFDFWVSQVEEGQIVNLFDKYGVDGQAVVDRLNRIRGYNGPKTDFLKKFFAGVDV